MIRPFLRAPAGEREGRRGGGEHICESMFREVGENEKEGGGVWAHLRKLFRYFFFPPPLYPEQ